MPKIAQEGATHNPAADSPAAPGSGVPNSGAGGFRGDGPVVAESAAEESGAEESGVEQSGAEKSGAEESGAEKSDAAGPRSGPPLTAEQQLVREGDIAGDYLERLLDVLDYDGDIDLDVEAGRAVVSIDGGEDLDRLVGDRGAVLEALQELTRLAVQQSSGNRSRLMLDIAGWRQTRRDELTELGTRTAKDVLASGDSARMRPMTPFERKVVHDAVARVKGVSSESEGEEPRRQVVVFRGA